MTARAAPNLTTKLAAALLARGEIEYEHAKLMSAANVLSLYEWHHNIRHAEGGSNEFWNYEPILRAAHRKRTAMIDVPQIAKGKRIRRKEAEHRAAVALDSALERWADDNRRRAKRKINSKGFDKTKTRIFSGKVRVRPVDRKTGEPVRRRDNG